MASFMEDLLNGLHGVVKNWNTTPSRTLLSTEFDSAPRSGFGLASILDIAGQSLSRTAYEQAQQRRQEQDRLNAHKQQLILQGTLSAVENGSLPVEKAQAIFKQYRLPAELLNGPSAAAQRQLAQLRAEEETNALDARIREGLGASPGGASSTVLPANEPALRADGTLVAPGVGVTAKDPIEEQLKYANELIRSGNKTLIDRGLKLRQDVNSALKLEAEFKKTQNDPGPQGTENERSIRALIGYQSKVARGEKLTPEEEQDAASRRALLERRVMSVDPITGKPYFEQAITLPPSITVGRGAGQASGVPVNRLPGMSGGRRPVDADTEKKLSNLASSQSQAENLSKIFDDKFAGFKSDVAADLALEAGRRLGGRYKDMAMFWQQYEQWATDMRAEKFGLSLTATEKGNFDKYRAKPSDDPKTARENIDRQLRIVNGAIERQLKSLDAAGYNMEQAKALVGKKPDAKAPPSPGKSDVIDFKDLPKGRK